MTAGDHAMDGAAEQSKIWSHFQGEGASYFRFSHPRQEALCRSIHGFASGRLPTVLNVGWGDGHLERLMLSRGWAVHALDPDPVAMRGAAQAGIQAHVGVVESIPMPDESLDFVVMSEVLEHLTDEQRRVGLREVRRALKRGGRLIGTVPYDEDMSLNEAVCPQCAHRFHRWGHRKAFDLRTLRDELVSVFGIEGVEVRRTAFPDWKRGPWGRAKALARVLLARFGAAIAQPSLLFVARKP